MKEVGTKREGGINRFAHYCVLALLAAPLACAPENGGSVAAKKNAAQAPSQSAAEWTISSEDSNARQPALLWNDKLGVQVGWDGTGNGLKAFASDVYGAGGEEKLRAQSNPLDLDLGVDSGKVTAVSRSINFQDGVIRSRYETPNGVFSVETSIHTRRKLLFDSWSLFANRAKFCFPKDVLIESVGAKPVSFGPANAHVRYLVRIGNVTESWGLTPDKSRTCLTLTRSSANAPMILSRIISIGEGLSGPASSPLVAHSNFDSVIDASRKEWQVRSETDIEIEGPVEDQQLVRSFMFYLRSPVDRSGATGFAPFALSNERYGGHTFWDADVWDFPALAFVDPEAASAIPKYRLSKLNSAITPGGRLKFPWESSVSGREVAVGEFKEAEHISGDVAWSMKQAEALGLVSNKDANKVVKGVGDYYRTRATRQGAEWQIRNVMSVDEWTRCDNDLYTNVLAQYAMNGGLWDGPNKFKLTRDAESLIAFDKDAVIAYKQTAVPLTIFPLQFPEAERNTAKIMDRFEAKSSQSGPAMSDTIHATIRARLGQTEKAYKLWHNGIDPFMRPLGMFSEKRDNSGATYFTTGAAGALNTVIYGFLGFRIDSHKQPGASWSIPLKAGKWLSVKPNLPPEWKKVRFRNFHVLGKTYTLEATHQDVRVTQGD